MYVYYVSFFGSMCVCKDYEAPHLEYGWTGALPHHHERFRTITVGADGSDKELGLTRAGPVSPSNKHISMSVCMLTIS